jgi:hypothetical protein
MQYGPNVQISIFATSRSPLRRNSINYFQGNAHTAAPNTAALPCSWVFFSLIRFDAIHPSREIALWNSSTGRYAHNKKDQANHQEQNEHQLGNPRRSGSNTREPKQRSYQCDYKKK